jgi:hypothetical protein
MLHVFEVVAKGFWPNFIAQVVLITSEGVRIMNVQFLKKHSAYMLVPKNDPKLGHVPSRFNILHAFKDPGTYTSSIFFTIMDSPV